MTNTELLYRRIEASGLKKGHIAKVLGISETSLANKIQNITEFKTGEVQALCRVLGISDLEEKECLFFCG